MPSRIQRKRERGWRMPENAVYVGRPTIWGNPYKVGGMYHVACAYDAVVAYRVYLEGLIRAQNPGFIERLRGKDLACWCPLDQPCHADVLLEIANK